MRVLLVSTYDLGRQPFGLASPAAWLRAEGHEVRTSDLSRESLNLDFVLAADWIAFHLPMHTATRMAIPQIAIVRKLNPAARLCCYGLYASVNEEMLRSTGVIHVIGGEFEQALVDVIGGRSIAEPIVLDRLSFRVPDRTTLPALSEYAGLVTPAGGRVVGYTEASRGCKHLCRHCPIVPVYNGKFRVIQRDVVIADVRQQIAAGAQHVTFGDPDFFNGPTHALAIVAAFHDEFPTATYDVTIKIEHLLKHREALAELKRTGCLFITSAVESVDDVLLARLDKGHTRADFIEALALTRAHGLTLVPTFVAFTPWTSRENFLDLLRTLRELDLTEAVAPIQLAIRLLIPAGSRLLELSDLQLETFDAAKLAWQWKHPDPAMDALCVELQKLIGHGEKTGLERRQIFANIWEVSFGARGDFEQQSCCSLPHMTEAWYCCAEPVEIPEEDSFTLV